MQLCIIISTHFCYSNQIVFTRQNVYAKLYEQVLKIYKTIREHNITWHIFRKHCILSALFSPFKEYSEHISQKLVTWESANELQIFYPVSIAVYWLLYYMFNSLFTFYQLSNSCSVAQIIFLFNLKLILWFYVFCILCKPRKMRN